MNTDDLTERIARALARQDGYDPDKHCDEWVMDGMRESAAAVLPIVEAEVRAAKAEALREAARYFAGGLHCADMRTTPEETVRDLNRRAAEYEAGDSDEHR